uniref:Uncharacterized protein n=1 Tax=Avena sativa TaxID=4498 RepID=A0ACD5YG23_AVESA
MNTSPPLILPARTQNNETDTHRGSPSPHVRESTADTAQKRPTSHALAVAMMPPAAVALALLALWTLHPRTTTVRAQLSAPPAGAPAPSSWGELDCRAAMLNLSACLTYVESGSALTRPDHGCCGALSGVADGEAACVCGLVGGYGSFGVRVDAVRALALPTVCRVDAPPPSLCAALGMPVAEAPGGAVPAESGNGTPATTPATSAASSGPAATHGNRRRHLHLVLLLLPYCAALLTLLP